MRGGPDGDERELEVELEVVPLEEAPAPRPRRAVLPRVATWGGRHRRLLLVAALSVAGLGVAHAAIAVRGVRTLERHAHAAQALRHEYDEYVQELRSQSNEPIRVLVGGTDQQRIARATADYRRRVSELADRASDVVALDPSLRRLRRSIVGSLRDEATEARDGVWFPPFRVNFAAQQAEEDVRRRRLDPGAVQRVPPLRALDDLRKPRPLLAEATGARLFVSVPDGVVEMEVDSGRVSRLADVRAPVGPVAAADGFVGFVDTGDGFVVTFGSSRRGRPLGRYDEVFADADDQGVVWFLTRPLDEDDPRPSVAHAFDRDGVRRDEVALGQGTMAAVSRRWLVRAHYGERTASFEVLDRSRGGRVVAARQDGIALSLRRDVLAWWGSRGLFLRALPEATDRLWPRPAPGCSQARSCSRRTGVGCRSCGPGSGPGAGTRQCWPSTTRRRRRWCGRCR